MYNVVNLTKNSGYNHSFQWSNSNFHTGFSKNYIHCQNAYFASWRRPHFTNIELIPSCNTNYSLCLDKGFRFNYKKLSQIIHCFFKNTVLFSWSCVLPLNDKLVKYWKPRSRTCYGRASISSVIFVYIQFENWALCQMKWWLVILIYQYYYIRMPI